MEKTMQKTQTLFSRYKRMINTMWADGQRGYTANDLNFHVAAYENQTWWKRSNNNECYTTRLYQTALKHLGCLTKIKRGLWQINGPIPEWFGSFHISALKSRYALQELEKSSTYWKSLPAEHKVNPWKNIDPMRVVASTQQTRLEDLIDASTGLYEPNKQTNTNKQTMENERTNNEMVISEPGIMLSNTVTFTTTTPSGIVLECKCWTNLWNTEDPNKPWDGEVSDLEIFITTNRAAKYEEVNATLITLHGKEWFDNFVKECEAKGLAHAIANAKPAINKTKSNEERMFTKDEVVELIESYLCNLQQIVDRGVSNSLSSLDVDDVTTIDFDTYSRRLDIDLDHNAIADAAADEIESAFKDYNTTERIVEHLESINK